MKVVADLGTVTAMKITDIRPYEHNPRKMPDRAIEMVAESLKQFGWKQPIVVDKDHVIVVGHTRWQAAQRIGADVVPVVIADDLTEDQIRAYRIADNRTADFNTWDFPELILELESIPDEFAAVLALEDWQSIIEQFEEEYGIDVPPDVAADAEGGFTVNVVFVDKQSAEAAQEYLVNLDGVLDVRYKV